MSSRWSSRSYGDISMGSSERSRGIRVFVMLPLDTVTADGVFKYASSPWFTNSLQFLAASGVRGVAIDVWWGVVEREPQCYNWQAYKQLFRLVKSVGLSLQVVFSFHSCGGNVGDDVEIPLPAWVLKVGEQDPDLFFTDRPRAAGTRHRNREYVSFFADGEPVLAGRTPMQCYSAVMRSFRDCFNSELGGLIEELVLGAGPCGELRYPSYVAAHGWRFPGIGEFQCYDRRALASLAATASTAGRPEWGLGGPDDAGSYNSLPQNTRFFQDSGSWQTDYGRFFLSWYSEALLEHGERLIRSAHEIFGAYLMRSDPPPGGGAGGGGAGGGSGTDAATATPRSPGVISHPITVHTPQGPASNNHRHHSRGTAPPGSMSEGGVAADALAAAAEPMVGAHPVSWSPGSSGHTPLASSSTTPRGGAGVGGGDRSSAEDLSMSDAQADLGVVLRSKSANCDSLGIAPHLLRELSRINEDFPMPSTSSASSGARAAAAGGSCSSTSVSTARTPLLDLHDRLGGAGSISGDAKMEAEPQRRTLRINLKIAGVHWWYRTSSHAAELTAGYYNTKRHDGYTALVQMCASYNVDMTLTCVEMCDGQHPFDARCGPEGLLMQVRKAAAKCGCNLAGENALPCFSATGVDMAALQRVVANLGPWPRSGQVLHKDRSSYSMPDLYDTVFSSDVSWSGTAPSPIPHQHSEPQHMHDLPKLSAPPPPPAPPAANGRIPEDLPPGSDGDAADSAPPRQRYLTAGGPGAKPPRAFAAAAAAAAAAASGKGGGRGGGSENGYWSADDQLPVACLPSLKSFTFLRLSPNLMKHQLEWVKFMDHIKELSV